MPDVNVTLTVNDDGTVDLQKFADNEHLNRVKGVIDGLRGENAGQRTRIKELEPQVAEVETLKAQVAEWSGKVAMTPEEQTAFQAATQRLEAFKDLDPEKARAALDYQARTERDTALSTAFKTAGYDPEAALGLDGVRGLETRVEQVDGKAQAQVKVGDAWRTLDDGFVGERYGRFMGVLKTEPAAPAGKSPVGAANPAGGSSPNLEAAIKSGDTAAINAAFNSQLAAGRN